MSYFGKDRIEGETFTQYLARTEQQKNRNFDNDEPTKIGDMLRNHERHELTENQDENSNITKQPKKNKSGSIFSTFSKAFSILLHQGSDKELALGTGELSVSKDKTLKESNLDTSEIFEDETLVKDATLKSIKEGKVHISYRNENVEKYIKNVEAKDIFDAMFTAQDLSEKMVATKFMHEDGEMYRKVVDGDNYHEQAALILKNIKNTVDNAQTFNDVHIYDGKTDKLKNQLTSKQTKEYLNTEKGQAILKELGIRKLSELSDEEQNKIFGTDKIYSNLVPTFMPEKYVSDGNYLGYNYVINGYPCNIYISDDGTFRVSYTKEISHLYDDGFCNTPRTVIDGKITRTADFKLTDTTGIPKSKYIGQ